MELALNQNSEIIKNINTYCIKTKYVNSLRLQHSGLIYIILRLPGK